MNPLAAVRSAITQGATSRAQLADATGLEPGTITLILEHLQTTGELDVEKLGGCPSTGCGSCALSSHCVGPTRGPVLLSLRRR